MIFATAVFLVTVSLLASAAAWAADDGLRRLGISTRWVWLAAMAAAAVLLVGPALAPGNVPQALGRAIGATPVFELPAFVVGPELQGGGPGVSGVLAALWAMLSLGMLALLVRTHRGLLSERSRWEIAELQGRDVYLSPDRGPAVAGVLRPWIVMPRWVLRLPESQLGLVLLHEEEHVRGRDSLLLAGALVFLVLTPWNPVTWWQLKRLRMAMEIDCDRRVLSLQPDREEYGNSLLSVAAKVSGPSLGLAAFTERPLSLKRRIVAMTEKHSRWTPLRAGLFVAFAMLIGVQACAVDSPVMVRDSATEDGDAVREASEANLERARAEAEGEIDVPAPESPRSAVDINAGPSFTPFTVAPSITNRTEVVEAMQAAYPPLLRGAGIGGTVRVYFFINEEGVVEDVRIDRSSGHPALDDAAMRVAGVYDFTPAMNKDEQVPVWVSFPITFQVR